MKREGGRGSLLEVRLCFLVLRCIHIIQKAVTKHFFKIFNKFYNFANGVEFIQSFVEIASASPSVST